MTPRVATSAAVVSNARQPMRSARKRGRTLEALERSANGSTGRLFSRMHRRSELAVELPRRLWISLAGTVSGASKQSAARLKALLVSGCSPSQWERPEQTLLGSGPVGPDAPGRPKLNRRVLPVNPAFGEHHQLLSVGQKVNGQTQGGHRGRPWSTGKQPSRCRNQPCSPAFQWWSP